MKKMVVLFSLLVFASFLLFGCESPEPNLTLYTITFNSNEGSPVASITQGKDTNINKPTDPTKDGFTFDGWYMNANLTTPVTWPHPLTGNVTFYAKWSENASVTYYTIIWEVNGQTVETDANVLQGAIKRIKHNFLKRLDNTPSNSIQMVDQVYHLSHKIMELS